MANDKAFKIKNGLSAKRYLQSSTAVAASDVDMSLGSYFTKTLSANTTFTFSNPPASGTAGSFALEVTGADVTVGYDLANASYDSVSFSVSGQESNPSGMFFKPDGTKMYICGTTGDDVNEYNLSTAWDVSTASYVQNFSVSSQDGFPQELFFKPDGTKMFVVGLGNDRVYEYSLSTAWDISTASYAQLFSVAAQESTPTAIFFKPDGTKMYISGDQGNDVNEYSLSTSWDVSTASYSQNFSVTSEHGNPQALHFKSDGTLMYVMGKDADDISQYTLSTAWDVSTASYDAISFSISSQEINAQSMVVKPDGTKFYIVGQSGDAVYQYTLSGSSTATITYPASVKWSGATTPDAPAAGEKDVYIFVTTDGGTTYYAKQAGDAVA